MNPLIILCMSEYDDMEVHTMWGKVAELKQAFESEQNVKNLLHGASAGTPKVFLGIISSDSSISYYFVEQRSLSMEEVPKKAC